MSGHDWTRQESVQLRHALQIGQKAEVSIKACDRVMDATSYDIFIRDEGGENLVLIVFYNADEKECSIATLTNATIKRIAHEGKRMLGVARRMNGGRTSATDAPLSKMY